MSSDCRPYGIGKKRKKIDALRRYTWEQGLVPAKVEQEALFTPSVVNLSQLRP